MQPGRHGRSDIPSDEEVGDANYQGHDATKQQRHAQASAAGGTGPVARSAAHLGLEESVQIIPQRVRQSLSPIAVILRIDHLVNVQLGIGMDVNANARHCGRIVPRVRGGVVLVSVLASIGGGGGDGACQSLFQLAGR